MKPDKKPDFYPVFPKSWAEILPPEVVLDAENLVESIYTLHTETECGETRNPAGCAQPKPPDGGPRNLSDSPPRILPPRHQVFRALDLTPPQAVRAVILGQDPYPSAGHANGLAFSVLPHIKPFPPSLRNIFREYSACFQLPIPTSGDLTPWAERGVLLLNAVLTVREGKPGSHRRQGWQRVTEAVLQACLRLGGPVVFLLWGRDAQTAFDRSAASCGMDVMLDNFTVESFGKIETFCTERVLTSKNTCESKLHPAAGDGGGMYVLRSSHPSPLGAAKPCGASPPFLGSRPFLRANALLGGQAIDWRLP